MSVTKDRSKAVVMLLDLCKLISCSVFHGLVGCYIFAFYFLLQEPSRMYAAVNPQANAGFLAYSLTGAVIGAYAGVLVCLSHHLFKQRPGFTKRCIALASPSLMSAGLLTMLEQPNDWRTFAIYFVPGAVLGLTTGLIAEAKRNPWDLLVRGIVRNQRETKPFAIFSGLGLRLGGLFGLLGFALLLAALTDPGEVEKGTREVLVIFSTVFTYFGLTLLIAFVPPPRWMVLVGGLILNVPTVILTVKMWETGPALPLIYLLLWALFIAGRPASVRRRKVRSSGIHTAEPAWIKGR